MTPSKLLTLAVMATTFFGTHSIALGDDDDDIHAFHRANISLIEAIQIAQRDQNGQAIEAELDDDDDYPTIKITVLRDNRLYEVRIDAANGEITRVREDD